MKIYTIPESVNLALYRYDSKNLRFEVKEPLKFTIKQENFSSVIHYEVPEGFRTDLASVPSILWPLIGPFGKWSVAAIIHDYLYDKSFEGNISREQADKIFYDAMIKHHVAKPTALVMYWAVRLFGKSSWKK